MGSIGLQNCFIFQNKCFLKIHLLDMTFLPRFSNISIEILKLKSSIAIIERISLTLEMKLGHLLKTKMVLTFCKVKFIVITSNIR